MNELEELTKGLEKEFFKDAKTQNSTKTSLDKKESTDIPKPSETNQQKQNNPFEFFKNLEDEGDMMAGIEKLLNMKDFNDINMNQIESLEDSDPQTKEMMKLLSKIYILIDYQT